MYRTAPTCFCEQLWRFFADQLRLIRRDIEIAANDFVPDLTTEVTPPTEPGIWTGCLGLEADLRTSTASLKWIWQRCPIFKRHHFVSRHLHQSLNLQKWQFITEQRNL